MVVTIKYYKVFACPDCRKKFYDLRELNIHYTKAHPEQKERFVLLKNGKVGSRSKKGIGLKI